MKNKKYLLLSFSVFFLIIAFFFSLNNILNISFRDMFANVANIDVFFLKQWQQKSGFNKNLAFKNKDNDVSLLQKALSTDVDIYPEGTVSGFFGENTQKAVIAFQKENSLPETGIFDEETRKKMNEIFYGELCPIQTVEYSDYTDFIFSKFDKEKKLPDDFIPKDLRNVKDFGLKNAGGVVCLRHDALLSLKNMFDSAKKEGVKLAVTSGFRKSKIQEWLVDYYIRNFGIGQLDGIALPGYSEHQLGTAVDLTGASVGYKGTFGDFYKGVEYEWLTKNASKYGFFLSYPVGHPDYKFEPWHWRFWGIKN